MIPLIGLIFGLLIGIFMPYQIPVEYSTYVVVAILAVVDSVFGAAAANLRGKFNMRLFWTGILGNTALAMLLTFIGENFGVQLYLAPVFAFGTRVFSNYAIIRRRMFMKQVQVDENETTDKN